MRSQQADLSVANHLAVCNVTTGNIAEFRHAEYVPDLNTTKEFFLEGRIQQAFHGFFNIFNRVIDNAVESDVNAFPLGMSLRLDFRADIKADNDGARSR